MVGFDRGTKPLCYLSSLLALVMNCRARHATVRALRPEFAFTFAGVYFSERRTVSPGDAWHVPHVTLLGVANELLARSDGLLENNVDVQQDSGEAFRALLEFAPQLRALFQYVLLQSRSDGRRGWLKPVDPAACLTLQCYTAVDGGTSAPLALAALIADARSERDCIAFYDGSAPRLMAVRISRLSAQRAAVRGRVTGVFEEVDIDVLMFIPTRWRARKRPLPSDAGERARFLAEYREAHDGEDPPQYTPFDSSDLQRALVSYRPLGMLLHAGSANAGHYTALVGARRPYAAGRVYYEMDETRVSLFDASSSAEQERFENNAAFILYELAGAPRAMRRRTPPKELRLTNHVYDLALTDRRTFALRFSLIATLTQRAQIRL